jgi:hypothetical protein
MRRTTTSLISAKYRAVCSLPTTRVGAFTPPCIAQEIATGTVHKDDWSPWALFNVGELDAVHPQVTRRRSVIGPCLPDETTTEHHDSEPDGADPAHDRLPERDAAMVMGGGTTPRAVSIIAQRWLTEGKKFDVLAYLVPEGA